MVGADGVVVVSVDSVVVVPGAFVDEKIEVTVEKIDVTISVVVSAFTVVVVTGATHLQQTSSVLSKTFPCSSQISSVSLQNGTQLSWYKPSTYVHSQTWQPLSNVSPSSYCLSPTVQASSHPSTKFKHIPVPQKTSSSTVSNGQAQSLQLESQSNGTGLMNGMKSC